NSPSHQYISSNAFKVSTTPRIVPAGNLLRPKLLYAPRNGIQFTGYTDDFPITSSFPVCVHVIFAATRLVPST
ncbi:glycosyltransferase family 15 protein, partial [Moniliophthora roreri]